jgi:uncharacterized protein (TIGR00369 family)
MKSKPAVTEEELKQILSESSFAKIYGFQVQSFANGECTLAIPFQPALERPGGMVAGVVFMAAADVAMWMAIMTLLGTGVLTVTMDLKTAFLSSAIQEDIRCTARVLKLGRILIYGIAECCTPAGQLLTHHTITYIRK